MNRTYECMLLLDNREVRQGWEPLKDTVTGMFTKSGAEIVSARRWDERRLAYPINGQTRGTYLLVYYKAETAANAAIRRDLELSEPVMRHMMSVCDEIPQEAFEPEAEFDVNAIPTQEEPEVEAPAAEAKQDEDKGDAEGEAEGDAEAKAEGDTPADVEASAEAPAEPAKAAASGDEEAKS